MGASDRELWLRLMQERDEECFATLFRRHSDPVYNFCFRRLSSWSLAEDATQTTFTTLWQRAQQSRLDELRLDTALPMLLSMARDSCSNLLRSRRRRLRLVDRLENSADDPSATGTVTSTVADDNTADWVEAESTMTVIRQELDRLPARYRDVIELVVWAELSTAEAAAALGVPAGTVKSRLSRARKLLARSPQLAEVVTQSR